MADNGNDGFKISVPIEADPALFKAGLADAETQARTSAARMSESLGSVSKSTNTAAASARELGQSIKDTTGPWRALSSAIGSCIGIMSRFMFVVGALTAAMVGLATALKSAWEWLVSVGEAGEVAGHKLADPLANALKQIQQVVTTLNLEGIEQGTERLKEMQEQLRVMTAEGKDLVVNFRGQAMHLSEQLGQQIKEEAERLKNAVETARKSKADEENEKELKKEEAKAAKLADLIIAHEIRVAKKIRELDKERADARQKREEDLADYMAVTSRRLHSDQIERDKERAQKQIEHIRNVQSAADNLINSQRSATGGNSAVAVGRIAAALEDIARSPRGGAILRGRVD